MKTKTCKLIVLSVVLLMLAANGLAQANVLSPESTKNNEQRVKRKISFSRENTLTKNYKHSIGVDLVPFAQKLELDDFLARNNEILMPPDALEHGCRFFRKLQPWKIIYKYNLNNTSEKALSLRMGLLGFCKHEYKAWVYPDHPLQRDSRRLSFASYGLFAGVEHSYLLPYSFSLIIATDLGYYFSEICHDIREWQSINDGSGDIFSGINKGHTWTHTFLFSPSVQIEYRLLERFSIGIAANVNFRYYDHDTDMITYYYQFMDGSTTIYHPNNGGTYRIIPIKEQQFSVALTKSLYISYKF